MSYNDPGEGFLSNTLDAFWAILCLAVIAGVIAGAVAII